MAGSNRPSMHLSASVEKVLKTTANCYENVKKTLERLVLNATFDEDTNPMSRDGPPNRLLQKLLRELQAIETIMRMIQLPFDKGVDPSWMGLSPTHSTICLQPDSS